MDHLFRVPHNECVTFKDERQPLHWACAGGHDGIVEYLIDECNVPVDEADDVSFFMKYN